ncbi:GMC family oxidoreductase [Zooshikella ganghwensis]|uniref:GMC family oxidoreductase n=1 Tax=Zooshikella ganghwensis TaxID=202772 RepID=UPI000407BD69|nr:GMC family oxidoreductase [Zooshikella ganghwensis]
MPDNPFKLNNPLRRHFIRQLMYGSTGICLSSLAISKSRSITTAVEPNTHYDYIVIGSGAGGAPVAVNLAKAGYSVLLLEAGAMEAKNLNYQIPAFHLLASEDPTMNWNFYVKHYSDPKLHGRRFVKSQQGMLYPRASTVGGCTAHHAMLTLYPANKDWDNIAQLTGDKSWQSYPMRQYFDRVKQWLPIEQASPAVLLKDQVLSKLITAASLTSNTTGRAFDIEANLNNPAMALRSRFSLNPNDWDNVSAQAEGLFMIPQSTYHHQRRGTREYVLETMQQHPTKLVLQTEALVQKILFKPSKTGQLQATGVQFSIGKHQYQADPLAATSSTTPNKPQVAFARREVIVAAGAFNSPQLLQLSGIGPKALLKQHRIPVLANRPGVGENLQDRIEVAVVSRYQQPFNILKNCTFGAPNDPCMQEYQQQQPFKTYGTNGILAGIKKRHTAGGKEPELFIFGGPSRFEGYEPGFAGKAIADPRYFTWAILKGHTRNRSGYVRIRSQNPTQPPEINFRYFNDGHDGDYDLTAVREGIEFVRTINQRAEQLSWLDTNHGNEIVPGPDIDTKTEMDAFIKKEAWGHHASCSNKMGHLSDPKAVVDNQFKVIGTENVRIVDASIFPTIPGLFIVLPIYMIAEKASDDILREAYLHDQKTS